MNLVLFDFCETLVNFQTADKFVDYCMERTGKGALYKKIRKKNNIDNWLKKHWMLNKKLHLFCLKGLSSQNIDELAKDYYKEYIIPNLYSPVVDLLDNYRRNNHSVYIVSGGYSAYIKIFVDEHNLNGLIANDFCYKNGTFTGRIIQKDCMGKEKVIRVNKELNLKDYENTLFYSDSYSDLPLFNTVDEGILVSKDTHRKKADEYGLKQIIISEMR